MIRTVVPTGTLHTKGAEFAFVRDAVRRAGLNLLCLDFGMLGEPAFPPEIGRAEVAAERGADIERLRAEGTRMKRWQPWPGV